MVVRQAPSVFQPIIGHQADRLNLRFLVILGPAITGIAMSLLGIAHGYLSLTALLLITGFSSAAFHAVGPAMAGTLSGSNLGRGMGIWMLCGELGRTIGPILIVSVIGLWGISGTPYLVPAGVVASLVLLLRMRSVASRVISAYKALTWQAALKRMAPVMVPPIGHCFCSRVYDGLPNRIPTHLLDRRRRQLVAIGRISFRTGRRGHWRRANRRMGKRPMGTQTDTRLLHDFHPHPPIYLSRNPGLGLISHFNHPGLCRPLHRSRGHGNGTGKLPRKSGICQWPLHGRGIRASRRGNVAPSASWQMLMVCAELFKSARF